MKQKFSKINLSFALMAIVVIGSLLLPGVSTAMASMDFSDCQQQVSCKICVAAVIPEIQGTEKIFPELIPLKIVVQEMEVLPIQPASPPPKA